MAREQLGQVEQVFVDFDKETGEVYLSQPIAQEQVLDKVHAFALGDMIRQAGDRLP